MRKNIASKLIESAAASASAALAEAIKRKQSALLRAQAKPIEAEFVVAIGSATQAIADHLGELRQWSQVVRFADLQAHKSVLSIYVDLDTYLVPLRLHVSADERVATRPLLPTLASTSAHAAILGSPGSGKTTSLQKICADFFRTGKALGKYNFPILIRLREIPTDQSPSPIYEHLQQLLSIAVAFPKEENEAIPVNQLALVRGAVNHYLDGLSALILLDGFDELTDHETRLRVIAEIELLTKGLHSSRIVITSRSSEFRYHIANLDQFEIAPLSNLQIGLFASRWLGSKRAADDFIYQIDRSPYRDTAIRPLTIAHLCAIYERIGTLPEKPKSVYRRIVYLLLEEWDSQRQIVRRSIYSGFDLDRKLEFLAHVAFILTVDGNMVFDTERLRGVYIRIHSDYGLPARSSSEVINEIQSHTGLIVEGSYGSYEFAHKSLQEFLAADYIVRLPSIQLISSDISKLPNELAVATSLSSKPADYLVELVLTVAIPAPLEDSWFSIFLSRLALEKVEFKGGSSQAATWAALVLLTKADAVVHLYSSMLQPLFPSNLASFIEQRYSVHRRAPEFIYFKARSDQSDDVTLPLEIRVPIHLL